jgi:hypothetical protein
MGFKGNPFLRLARIGLNENRKTPFSKDQQMETLRFHEINIVTPA